MAGNRQRHAQRQNDEQAVESDERDVENNEQDVNGGGREQAGVDSGFGNDDRLDRFGKSAVFCRIRTSVLRCRSRLELFVQYPAPT